MCFRLYLAPDEYLWGMGMAINPRIQPLEQTFCCFYNFFLN